MPQISAGVLLGLTFAGVMIWWLDLPPGSGASLLVLLACVGLASLIIALARRVVGSLMRPRHR